jgi:hypothetical protein
MIVYADFCIKLIKKYLVDKESTFDKMALKSESLLDVAMWNDSIRNPHFGFKYRNDLESMIEIAVYAAEFGNKSLMTSILTWFRNMDYEFYDRVRLIRNATLVCKIAISIFEDDVPAVMDYAIIASQTDNVNALVDALAWFNEKRVAFDHETLMQESTESSKKIIAQFI